jgi:hypothetical protein
MRRNELTAFLSTLGLSLAFSGLLAAQDPPSNSAQSTSKEKKDSPAKPKKTWTEDDVSALRSPADSYTDQKVEAQKAEAQKAPRTASSPEGPAPAANSPAPAGKSPALSNPKTVDSADKMIAWEERDIAAQEEHLDRLKIQLESASLDDRDRLQKLINEREKIIAETRKERDALVKQKSDLEKKGNASAAASPAEPPQ